MFKHLSKNSKKNPIAENQFIDALITSYGCDIFNIKIARSNRPKLKTVCELLGMQNNNKSRRRIYDG